MQSLSRWVGNKSLILDEKPVHFEAITKLILLPFLRPEPLTRSVVRGGPFFIVYFD